MSAVVSAFVAHQKSLGRQHMVLDEIQVDGHPLTVYWSSLTPARRRDLLAKDRDDEAAVAEAAGENVRPSRSFGVVVVVEMAETEDGKRMFAPADAVTLDNEGSAHVITRLAAAMLRPPTVEQAVKN